MRSVKLIAMFMALLITARAACAASPASEVAHDVFLLPGQLQADRSPDGNSEILRGPTGVIVIDTGRNDAHTGQLIDFITTLNLPLVAVINTHWHLDHIGGNARIKQRWPAVHIYAHPSLDTALKGFHADYRQQLEQYLPTLKDDSPEKRRYQAELRLLKLDGALAETDRVSKSTTLTLGGRQIEIHVSPHAVTEGDLWMFDPSTRTLIAGDLVTLPVPLFDSACPEGWRRALDTLAKKNFTILIPGHGAPMERIQFEQYRTAFTHLLSCAAQTTNKQHCIDNWFADARSLIAVNDEPYGRTLLFYYFDNFIKPDVPGRSRWCKAA